MQLVLYCSSSLHIRPSVRLGRPFGGVLYKNYREGMPWNTLTTLNW